MQWTLSSLEKSDVVRLENRFRNAHQQTVNDFRHRTRIWRLYIDMTLLSVQLLPSQVAQCMYMYIPQRDWVAQSVMSATDTLGQLGCMWLACRTPSSGQWTNVRTMMLKDTVVFTVARSYCGAVWELPSEAVRPYSTVILTRKGLSSCGAWVWIPAMAGCSPYRLLSTPAVPYSRAVI
jgi:hypothetical protein